ncbi:uncharacterized protein LOC124111781 [Haliotis rufescens]|uniref:uncharacterized protein LOC124111781 n=1 Tax=Haliotis rufescens TaxID=6454 RepID=UPI00201FAEFC|nr:uncharacterized protein LOC124111781 [Haliotis rufescens]
MKKKGDKDRSSSSVAQKEPNDATSLLKKITPKLKRSTYELTSDEDKSPSSKVTSRQVSTSSLEKTASRKSVGDEHGPDWYEELSDNQVSAFKEVFDMLDSSHTGTLNADSLYEGLRRVDSEITRHEVEDVLRNLDKDGNGEIDFDEFLFHISHQGDEETGGDEHQERRMAFTKRQRLFYSAITDFHLKRTIENIQKAQQTRVNQPHVLSHYTAGARLIGLTDRQLAIEMKKMHKNMKQQDSPYAQPLQLVVKEGGRRAVRRAIRSHRKAGEQPVPAAAPATTAPAASSDSTQIATQMSHMKQMAMQSPICIPSAGPLSAQDIPEVKVTMYIEPQKVGWSGVFSKFQAAPQAAPQHEVNFNTDLRESFKMLAERGSIMSKLPDVHKILALRDKLVRDMEAVKASEGTTPEQSKPELPTAEQLKKSRRKGRQMSKGWTLFRVDRDKVPLPALKIKYKHHKPTMEDLPNIREKVSQAIDDYYESLRQAHVQTGLDHWDRIYSDRIRSHKLMENFREVYRAYSPHKQEEAFVVCPWVPGPFRHIPSLKNGPRCCTPTPFCKQQGGRQTPDHVDRSSSRLKSGRTSRSGRSSYDGQTSGMKNRPVSAF